MTTAVLSPSNAWIFLIALHGYLRGLDQLADFVAWSASNDAISSQ
jgi:hypothetical protein